MNANTPEGAPSAGTENLGQSLTTDQAANVIEGLLNQKPEEEETGNTVETDTDEITEEEIDGAEPVEQEAFEEDDYDDELDGEYEEGEELPQTMTVVIDGQEQEVSLEEARNGYSRQADYTRNMNALREKAQEIETAHQQHIQARDQYQQRLAQIEQQLASEMEQEPDWQAAFEEDPIEALRIQAEWNAKKQKQEAVRQQNLMLRQQQQAEWQQAQQQRLVQEGQRLLEVIPEWRDADVRANDQKAIANHAMNVLGFTQDEVAQAADSRAVRALRDSMLYHELLSKQGKAKAKVKGAPKVMKPGAKKSSKPSKTKRLTAKRNQLKQSGSVTDAAELLKDLI